jgi:ABC-type antimicrobial peptide transport system permease subunit
MGHVASGLIGRPRFYAIVVTLFGAIASAIAAIGIYGVLAFALTQRQQEFGVRIALGATSRQILTLAIGQGLVVIAVGVTLGLASAAALTRYLSGMLFGVTPLDGGTYVIVTAFFAGTALLASYIPARRATKVDPVVVLRTE